MPKLSLQGLLNTIAKNFKDDPSKMLIVTGAIGWAVSSLAQIGAILFNPKISDKEKSFLVPQEMSDAIVNIASFLVITNSVKIFASKLFSTGKVVPKSVREFLNKNKALYEKKIGKIDFNLDDVLPKNTDLYNTYDLHKSLGTSAATVGAGILATNIVTPLLRNKMASSVQKNYIESKEIDDLITEREQIKRPQVQTQQYLYKSYNSDLRI